MFSGCAREPTQEISDAKAAVETAIPAKKEEAKFLYWTFSGH